MRPITYHPFGLMVPRSPAILILTLGVVVALNGVAQAQPAAQPKPAPEPKTPAQPAAPPEKQPAQPVPAEAAQPTQPEQPAAAQRSYEPLPYTDGLKTKRTEVQRWLRGGEIPAAGATGLTIINVTDPREIDAYLATSEGQEAILNVLSSRAETLRRILVR